MTYFWLILVSVLLDQASKLWVRSQLLLGESVPVIPGFFHFTHVRNPGAAWSFLANRSWGIYLLTGISMVAFIALIYYLYRVAQGRLRFPIALMAAGCLGNLIDRLAYGYVIDFFDFRFGSYHYPVFNVADMLLVVGTLLFALLVLLHKEERADKADGEMASNRGGEHGNQS